MFLEERDVIVEQNYIFSHVFNINFKFQTKCKQLKFQPNHWWISYNLPYLFKDLTKALQEKKPQEFFLSFKSGEFFSHLGDLVNWFCEKEIDSKHYKVICNKQKRETNKILYLLGWLRWII